MGGVGFFVSYSSHSGDLIHIHITKSFYGVDTGNYQELMSWKVQGYDGR